MAKPIEPTPTLTGIDAEMILLELANPSYDEQKEKFLKECRENYKKTK